MERSSFVPSTYPHYLHRAYWLTLSSAIMRVFSLALSLFLNSSFHPVYVVNGFLVFFLIVMFIYKLLSLSLLLFFFFFVPPFLSFILQSIIFRQLFHIFISLQTFVSVTLVLFMWKILWDFNMLMERFGFVGIII